MTAAKNAVVSWLVNFTIRMFVKSAVMVDIVIVVASNDNESSQFTLPDFLICVPVPVIGGLTRFLTMAEVAEVEDGVVIIDCVAISL